MGKIEIIDTLGGQGDQTLHTLGELREFLARAESHPDKAFVVEKFLADLQRQGYEGNNTKLRIWRLEKIVKDLSFLWEGKE